MPGNDRSPDLLVVGGGVIGLAVAWRARESGMSVTLLERDRLGRGTSHVAAGMLAPVTEVEFGEAGRRVLALGLRSAAMWPAFAADLEAASDVEVGLRRTGALLVARDDDEARELDRQIAFRESLGLRSERLRASEARALEPSIAPTIRLALRAPEDHSVDPRPVLAALQLACERAGVTLREHRPVSRVVTDGAGERVTGVNVQEGGASPEEFVAAERIVIAAGPWVERIDGLPARARVPVRPVKGQILRLRDPAGPGLLSGVVRFEGGYLVPRGDGRYVLGATVQERGFDLAPEVGGIYELLRDAHEVVPGVSELEIEELSVGLRPGTPDNAPAIGRGALEGLLWAAGHHRNGILLAPVTAALALDALTESKAAAGNEPLTGSEAAASANALTGSEPLTLLREACDPLRFAPASEELAARGKADEWVASGA